MFGLSEAQLQTGLRVLKQVAAADGAFESEERELIAAVARVCGIDVDAEELDPIGVDEVARAFADPTLRTRVVQAMIVVAVIDGAVTSSELAVVRRYAEALGVDEPRVRNLAQLVEGNIHVLKLDAFRR